MADISKFKVPAGSNGALVEYDVKDAVARSSIPAASSSAPQAPGTAAVGTSTDYARADHVHPAQDLSGKLDTSLKGAANGLAELDANGLVPSSQLPSYVDDILEGYLNETDGKFYKESTYTTEIPGETGKIYVDLSTNKTYRWSGSAFVEISESLALGETSSTAYRGDRGKTAYDHASAKGSAFTSDLYKITTNSEGHVTAATAVVKADITALGIPAQDTTYNNATTSVAGLMSAADKTKLDGLANVIISDTTPTATEPTIWIDPDPSSAGTIPTTAEVEAAYLSYAHSQTLSSAQKSTGVGNLGLAAALIGLNITTVETITRTV